MAGALVESPIEIDGQDNVRFLATRLRHTSPFVALIDQRVKTGLTVGGVSAANWPFGIESLYRLDEIIAHGRPHRGECRHQHGSISVVRLKPGEVILIALGLI